MRMPAVVLYDPKMERRIRIDNQLVDQLEQVAETVQVGQQPAALKHLMIT